MRGSNKPFYMMDYCVFIGIKMFETKQNQQENTSLKNLEGQVEEEPPPEHQDNSKWLYQPPNIYKSNNYTLPDLEAKEIAIGKFEKEDTHKTLNERIKDMFKFTPERIAITYLQRKEKCPFADYLKEAA